MAKELDLQSPIVTYLKKNLSKGHKIQNLKWALINEGYSKTEVDKAIRIINLESEREMKSEELKQKKEQLSKPVLINDDMPEIERESFWQKIKHWF